MQCHLPVKNRPALVFRLHLCTPKNGPKAVKKFKNLIKEQKKTYIWMSTSIKTGKRQF